MKKNGLNTFLSRCIVPAANILLILGMPALAAAQTMDESWGVYVQGARTWYGDNNTRTLALGAMAPLMGAREVWSGKLSAYLDLSASRWRLTSTTGRGASLSQLVAIPTLRYRPDSGNAAWFLEAGLGLSYLDGIYATPDRTFSTRWNFSEVLGTGISFGTRGNQEVAVRLQHFSNGSAREPNPGENFVGLRYTWKF